MSIRLQSAIVADWYIGAYYDNHSFIMTFNCGGNKPQSVFIRKDDAISIIRWLEGKMYTNNQFEVKLPTQKNEIRFVKERNTGLWIRLWKGDDAECTLSKKDTIKLYEFLKEFVEDENYHNEKPDNT